MSASTQTLLQTIPQAVPIPERNEIVSAQYVGRIQQGEHSDADLPAVVCSGGEPITRGGETLTLGLVPMERRYAIGPVKDGRCEVLSQDEFHRMGDGIYLETFRMLDHPPGNVNLRHVPNVVDFVAVKVDEMNESRVVPLGTGHVTDAPPAERSEFWSDLQQKMVPASEVQDPKDDRIAELEAKLSEFQAASSVEHDSVVLDLKPAKPKEAAPCGKEVAKGFVRAHQKHCKDPACGEVDTE